MLRVVHVVDEPAAVDDPAFYAEGTGPGRVARGIRAVDRDIHLECWYPSVHGGKGSGFWRDDVDFRVFEARAVRGGNVWSPSLLRELRLASIHGVVMHVHGYPGRLLRAASVIRTRTGFPLVVQSQGAPADSSSAGLFARPVRLLREARDGAALRAVDQLYYVSAAERARVRAWVADERLRYQTMGVDTDRFTPGDPRAAREKLRLPVSAYVVLLVAADLLRDGADLAARALRLLPDEVVLAVVGDAAAPARAAIQGEAEKAGAGKRLFLLGDRDAESPDAYRAANLLLRLSRVGAAPSEVMAALATNVPVAAVAIPGVDIMLEGRGLAVTERSPQGIARAIEEARTMRFEPTRDFAVKQYGWDAIARATVADYRRLLSDR